MLVIWLQSPQTTPLRTEKHLLRLLCWLLISEGAILATASLHCEKKKRSHSFLITKSLVLGFDCSESYSVNLRKTQVFKKLILLYSRIQTCYLTNYKGQKTLAEMRADPGPQESPGDRPCDLAYPPALVPPVLM